MKHHILQSSCGLHSEEISFSLLSRQSRMYKLNKRRWVLWLTYEKINFLLLQQIRYKATRRWGIYISNLNVFLTLCKCWVQNFKYLGRALRCQRNPNTHWTNEISITKSKQGAENRKAKQGAENLIIRNKEKNVGFLCDICLYSTECCFVCVKFPHG